MKPEIVITKVAATVRSANSLPHDNIAVHVSDDGGGLFLTLVGPDGDMIRVNPDELEAIAKVGRELIAAAESSA